MAGTAVAEKVVETPAEPIVEKDEFADAFSMFSKDDKGVPGESASTTKAVEPDAPAVVLGADGKPVPAVAEPEIKTEIEGAPPEGETPEQKTAREATEAAEAAKAKDIVIGKPDGTADKGDVLERLVEALDQRKQTADTTTRTTNQQPQPLYSQQELGVLAEFAKEWPEVASANAILLNGLAKSLKEEVYREIALGMAPHIQKLGLLVNNAQYDDIERRVPGYEAVIPKVTEWANSQKVGYLKAAYTGVMENGTPEEIEHLIGQYRAETGDKTGVPAETPARVDRTPTLSPDAKKAAARLAPVVGKQTGIPAGAPQTFDSGFEQALKLLA